MGEGSSGEVREIGGRFAGRAAIVTGAGSGIGRAAAMRLVDEGARVVLADVNDEAAARVRSEFESEGRGESVRTFHCDVSEEADVMRLTRFAAKEFGRLDVMVNNAGFGGAFGRLVDTRVQDFDRTIAVLLRGVFLGIKHAAQVMIRQGTGGAIVNRSSIAALCGTGGGAAYSAAKAGVVSLTQSAAVQLASHRIRVNVVCPGWVLTPLIVRGDPDEIRAASKEGQPWPQSADPEQIASVVAFLASDDAEFVTGASLVADGGAMAEGPGFYSGHHPFGNLVLERTIQAGVTRFDSGNAPPS